MSQYAIFSFYIIFCIINEDRDTPRHRFCRRVITIARNNNQQSKSQQQQEPRINGEINPNLECRLIDAEGKQLGIYKVRDAVVLANEADLDLVEISSDAKPIVCRMMNYGKWKYENQKKAKENKQKNKQSPLKEMKFRCRIGDGDYETKKKHVIRFLESGSKVKITIMFRGRELSHPQLGTEILGRLADDLTEYATVIQNPSLEGRNMTMVVAPIKENKKQ